MSFRNHLINNIVNGKATDHILVTDRLLADKATLLKNQVFIQTSLTKRVPTGSSHAFIKKSKTNRAD